MTDTSEQIAQAFLTAHTVWNLDGIIAGCSSPSLDEWSAFAAALRTPRQLDAEVAARVKEAMHISKGHWDHCVASGFVPADMSCTLRLSDVKAMLRAVDALQKIAAYERGGEISPGPTGDRDDMIGLAREALAS